MMRQSHAVIIIYGQISLHNGATGSERVNLIACVQKMANSGGYNTHPVVSVLEFCTQHETTRQR